MTAPLVWDRHGAARDDCAALPIMSDLTAVLDACDHGRPGARLRAVAGLAELLAASGPIGGAAARRIGAGATPVRAVLFDKNASSNWALGWHQDRTVAVRTRRDAPGYGPWTVKDGMVHCEPPFAILAAMATVRVHLDDVPADNAPLLVAPGSHHLGRIAESAIAGAVARCGTAACLARRGDLWVYATPILHASGRATFGRRRRVLQVDYAVGPLGGGLDWLGV